MEHLIRQLVLSEIQLGMVLVEVATFSRSRGDAKAFKKARERAESSYLRARDQIKNLTKDAHAIAMTNDLQALGRAIDRLGEVPDIKLDKQSSSAGTST